MKVNLNTFGSSMFTYFSFFIDFYLLNYFFSIERIVLLFLVLIAILYSNGEYLQAGICSAATYCFNYCFDSSFEKVNFLDLTNSIFSCSPSHPPSSSLTNKDYFQSNHHCYPPISPIYPLKNREEKKHSFVWQASYNVPVRSTCRRRGNCSSEECLHFRLQVAGFRYYWFLLGACFRESSLNDRSYYSFSTNLWFLRCFLLLSSLIYRISSMLTSLGRGSLCALCLATRKDLLWQWFEAACVGFQVRFSIGLEDTGGILSSSILALDVGTFLGRQVRYS